MSLFTLALRQLLDGKLDIAAESFREPYKFKFLGLLGGVGVVFFQGNLRGIDRRLRTAQTDPHFLVFPGWIVRHVDGKNLRPLLVGQTEQRLYLVELVDILPLVKKDLAVAVVDDGSLDNGRRNDVLHFLSDHHSLAEELPDGLE